MLLTLSALLTLYLSFPHGPALDLDTVTLPQAGTLDGRLVRATVTSGEPHHYTYLTAAGNDLGGITRSVVVPRDVMIDGGDVVRVVGVLSVIRHPAVAVNGVNVPGWDEVRVTGVRVR